MSVVDKKKVLPKTFRVHIDPRTDLLQIIYVIIMWKYIERKRNSIFVVQKVYKSYITPDVVYK